jgi:hypothetical protein
LTAAGGTPIFGATEINVRLRVFVIDHKPVDVSIGMEGAP